jgi:hypothetical protein
MDFDHIKWSITGFVKNQNRRLGLPIKFEYVWDIFSYICKSLFIITEWNFILRSFNSNLLAEWSFDGTLADQTSNFNATSYNSPSFITNGYVNQALSFNASENQSLYTSYIPLANTSFAIDTWLYPTRYPNIKDHSIVDLCFSRTTSLCLHLTIRNTSSSYYLYIGFMNNDCANVQTIALNQWIHAGFVLWF